MGKEGKRREGASISFIIRERQLSREEIGIVSQRAANVSLEAQQMLTGIWRAAEALSLSLSLSLSLEVDTDHRGTHIPNR